MTTVESTLARRAGTLAAQLGRPLACCPYDPDRDPLLAMAFVRGWRSAGLAIEKAAAAEDGGVDPKAPDERWPGWEQDLAIAAAAAAAMMAALTAGVASSAAVAALAVAFREWAPPGTPIGEESVAGWLRATTTLGPDIEAAIRPVIEDIWAEGYMVGTKAAGAVVDNLAAGIPPREAVTVDVDWQGWTPGDSSAARRIMTADGSIQPWLDLLRDAGITIKRIADNRLREVAKCLHDGLQRGASVDEIAKDLQGTVADPKWCYKVALTETNRALSAATLDTYEQAGLGASEWMTALDQRVCKRCKGNEDAGPVRLGERYPSSDYHPPSHPNCRCALVPALLDDLLKAAGMDWRAWNQLHPERQRNSLGQWGRGSGASLAVDSPLDWLTDDEDDGEGEDDRDEVADAIENRASLFQIFGEDLDQWPTYARGNLADLDEIIGAEPASTPIPVRRPVTAAPGQRMAAENLFEATDPTVRLIGAQQAYEGTFGGYSTVVTDAFRAAHIFQVKGTIFGPDGDEVGHFDRMLVRDRGTRGARDGKVYAIHALLELDRDHQGQGFAEAFNSHLFDWYRESNLDRVALTANIDVGGYAWARNGYDWADKNAPKPIIRNLGLMARLDSGMIPADRLAEQQRMALDLLQRFKTTKFGHPDYPTPFEVSQLGRWDGAGRDDWWIGKRALWGATWEGVKPL